MEHQPRQPEDDASTPIERAHTRGDMVCVTLNRPPHFWRFACPPAGTGDLLERLAEMADDPDTSLTWHDAELIASEIVLHHHLDHPSAG